MAYGTGDFYNENLHGEEYPQQDVAELFEAEEKFVGDENNEVLEERFFHTDEFNEAFEAGLTERPEGEYGAQEAAEEPVRWYRRLLRPITGILKFVVLTAAVAAAVAPTGVFGAAAAQTVQTALHETMGIHNPRREWTVIEEANCGGSGLQSLLCADCGAAITTRVTQQLSHIPGEWCLHTEATCLQDGQEELCCTLCQQQLSVRTVPRTAHLEGTWIVEQEASCDENGFRRTACVYCGKTLAEEEIPAAHTEEPDAAIPATCAAEGLSAGAHCAVCGVVLKEQTVIPKTDHRPETDQAVEATCSTTGLTEGIHCADCKEVLKKQEIIKTLPHTPISDEAVAATCTASGLTEGSHCSACGEILVKQEVIPAAHSPESIPGVAADCWNTGWTEGSVCSVCQTVLIEPQETPIYHARTVITPYTAPTCDLYGSTEAEYCGICQAVIREPIQLMPTGHTWVRDPNVATHESYICSSCQITSNTPY